MTADLVDIGAAKLDAKSNALLAQVKSTRIGEDDDEAPGFDDSPIFGALGLTAFPAPANENGRAQGVKEDLPGTRGAITGMRDTRTAAVTAELGPGETCVHSTGEGFDSRMFFKNQLSAIVVGPDMAIVVDRKNKKITLSAFGCHIEASKEAGCYMAQGGAMMRVKDGFCSLVGQVVLGGATPFAPLCAMVNGVPTPVPGLFAGK